MGRFTSSIDLDLSHITILGFYVKDKSGDSSRDKYSLRAVKSMKGSRLPLSSLMECMARVAAPTSTVLIPNLDEIAGPMVLPQGRSLLITKLWTLRFALLHTCLKIADDTESEA